MLSSGFSELCRLCGRLGIAKYKVTVCHGDSTHAGEGDGDV